MGGSCENNFFPQDFNFSTFSQIQLLPSGWRCSTMFCCIAYANIAMHCSSACFMGHPDSASSQLFVAFRFSETDAYKLFAPETWLLRSLEGRDNRNLLISAEAKKFGGIGGGCHGDPSPLRTVHFASQSHASVNIALHCFGFCPIEILTTDHTSCSLGSIPEGRRMSKSETHIVFLHYNLVENDMGQSLFQKGRC